MPLNGTSTYAKVPHTPPILICVRDCELVVHVTIPWPDGMDLGKHRAVSVTRAMLC